MTSPPTKRKANHTALWQTTLWEVISDIQGGWIPEVDPLTWDDWQEMRRLGYLIDLAGTKKAALTEMVAILHRRALAGYGGGFPIENVIPHGVIGLEPWDEIAEKWGYRPGLSTFSDCIDCRSKT